MVVVIDLRLPHCYTWLTGPPGISEPASLGITVLPRRPRRCPQPLLNHSSITPQFRLNLTMSFIAKGLIQFDEYEIDRARWQLNWREETVPLNRKTFDLLLFLVEHADRVVGKDELLHTLWPESFVEESNLTQHIFLLRKALSRHESGTKIIETVPGRGYRFAARINAVETELPPAADRIVIQASESITRITLEEEEEPAREGEATSQPVPLIRTPSGKRRIYWIVGGATTAAVLCVVGWFGWQRWLDHTSGAPVRVVLTPMDGTTGDTVLDKALTQALRMDIGQSPYVTVVPGGTVMATLTQMMHKPDDAITPAIAREICERTNSQGVLSGNIVKIGQHFLITEEASNCLDGSVIGQAKYEAASTEELPHAIDKLAANLRQKLGESRRSIARFDVPLFHDNTPSLDALKAFTLGTQLIREGKMTDAIAMLNKAVADDPKFASAYYNLAAAYGSAGDDLHEREFIAKAYSLKDTAMKPSQFAIETGYDSDFTGDMYELLRTFHSWVSLYPNSSQAWSGLANTQRGLGMDSEALASSLRTIELLPHSQGMLANLSMDQLQNGDTNGARATCERAIHDNLDGDGIRVRYLYVAYLLQDAALLRAQRAWFAEHPQATQVLGVEAEIAMAEGRFKDAHRLIARIHDLYHQLGLSGPDDERVKFAAVDLMQTGDLEEGKKIFQQGPVDIEDGQEVLGLVYTGDIAVAQADLHTMETKYPRATMVNLFWVPRTQAAIAMAEHKPAEAAALLETARPLDKTTRVIPWLRGNAYLAAGQAGAAEKDFRSVIDHPGYDPAAPYISLSWLGLGESLAAQGNRSAAVAAYQHFFSLWAHADPDAKLLLQAKQEFATLQKAAPAK
jgi:eukaryotic-like serine/threonine-protein kinase